MNIKSFIIQSKVYIAFIATILGLLVTIVTLISSMNKIKEDRDRQENNYKAQVTQTITWKDKYGREVATTYQIKLSAKELKHSKDSIIRQLMDNNKRLDNKIRTTESMLALELSAKGKATNRIDTVWKYINGKVTKLETDTLEDSLLYLTWVRDIKTDIIDYQYNLKPITINLDINYEKEGKWKLINIIIPRDKIYKVDVTSSNEKIRFNYVKFIKIK